MSEIQIEVFGRKCGVVVGKALMIVRDSKKHRFRKFDGYGLSIAVICAAQEKGATKVQMEIQDKNETYEASFEDFMEKGKDWTDMDGHDKQKILPLSEWKKVK